MIKGEGGNKHAKGSVKTLKLILNTHDKITKHSITDMTVKTRKRVDKKLRSLYELLDNKGLRTVKDGAGKEAYDGYGFDYISREFAFFWYFTDTTYGDSQLKKVVGKLLSLDMDFMQLDMTLTMQISTHPI